MKWCLLFSFILVASSAFAEESGHTYALPNTDTIVIAPVEAGPYWERYEITRQKKEAGKVISIPLQIEELDTDTGKLQTVNGVSFAAIDDPVFDPRIGKMAYAQKDGYVATYVYEYQLVKNLFKLHEVTKSEFTHCDEKTGECKDSKDTVIFKAHTNAQTH